MLNPAEPNKTREIKLTYTTDEAGDMEIDIDATGFEEDPQAVGLFLSATMKAISSNTANEKTSL
jgi:hypothetical protein